MPVLIRGAEHDLRMGAIVESYPFKGSGIM